MTQAFDDDSINAGAGDDTILDGLGNDTVYGESGDDVMGSNVNFFTPGFGGNILPDSVDPQPFDAMDLMYGGLGDDTIMTGDDADTLYGGEGLDELNGGIDNDVLYGESGDDMLFGASGDDIMYGGFGDDNFEVNEAGSDEIFGGADVGDGDNDTLDLSSVSADYFITYEAGTDDEDGTVTFLNGGGGAAGDQLVFSEIETIICFACGTRILTPTG